jgi:hypothetical protein
MSIEGEIRDSAAKIAAQQHQAASGFEKEYLAIQEQAEKLKTKRDNARTASDRLLNFEIKINGDYQCPACWIIRNARAALLPRPSQNRDDIFQCSQCGHKLTITY